MGRKSALTPDQWVEVERLYFITGKPINAIAKDFGVNESVIRRKIKPNSQEQEKAGKPLSLLALEKYTAADTLRKIDNEIAELPVVRQKMVNELSKRLENISAHLASAAEYGAATSHRLAGIAHAKAAEIDDANPLDEESMEVLKGIAVLTRMANDSSEIGMNLLKANKDMLDEANKIKPDAADKESPLVIARRVGFLLAKGMQIAKNSKIDAGQT